MSMKTDYNKEIIERLISIEEQLDSLQTTIAVLKAKNHMKINIKKPEKHYWYRFFKWEKT